MVDSHVLCTFRILVLVSDVVSLVQTHSFGADKAAHILGIATTLGKLSIRQLHQVNHVGVNLSPAGTGERTVQVSR